MSQLRSQSEAVPYIEWTDLSAGQSRALSSALASQGCAVVRSVFRAEEILRLRKLVKAHLESSGSRFGLGKTQPNAATAVPAIQDIFSHSAVTTLFKLLIGENQTVFTGHCDIHMNMLSGWHRDSGEAFGGYFSGDYIADDACRVFKMAIYLQDTSPTDGLSVVPASHRRGSYDIGQAVKAQTRVGDVVIFDVRLAHAGQLPDFVETGIKALNLLLKGKSRTVEDSPIATSLKQLYWRLIGRRDRLSIFFTYGADNLRTQEFAQANMSRQNQQAGIDQWNWPPALTQALASRGIKISEV